MIIALSAMELFTASMIGVGRQIKSLQSGRADNHGMKSDMGFHYHIIGACGEAVVAKFMGYFWLGSVDSFKAPDVGAYQVRTSSRDYLIIRKGDRDEEIFVGVRKINDLQYELLGWIIGACAKQNEFLQSPADRPPAWFVPKQRLNSIDKLGGKANGNTK